MIINGGLSASSLKTYAQCQMKYFYTYEQGFRQSADHLSFGTICHTCLEKWINEDRDVIEIFKEEWANSEMTSTSYYELGQKLLTNYVASNNKEEILNIGTEIEFKIEIAPEIFIKGFIDRVDVLNGETIEIVDYKTSFVALRGYEMQDDVQLSMYDLAASIMFPEYKNRILSLEYLRYSKASTKRDDEQREYFTEWLIDMFYKISSNTEPKAKLNQYCNWCMCKGQCEEYQDLLLNDLTLAKVANNDFALLWEEKGSIDNKVKILESRRDEITSLLKNEFDGNQRDILPFGNGMELYLTSPERHGYSLETVMSEFPYIWKDLVSVRKTETEKRATKEQKQRLVLAQDTYYVEPTLRQRKTKVVK